MTVLDFLRGVSGWFARIEGAAGERVCPRHHVEHTGKLVYAAAIDLALRRADGTNAHDERIRRRALRTASMLRTDPSTGSAVFFPGSLDSRNAATNLIDSGACCDVLAQVVDEAADLFSDGERAAIRDAVTKVCSTYLAKAVLVKEVPAQRMWGATGLARAARAFHDESFAAAACEAIARVRAQSHADGGIPYLPEPGKSREHAGLADLSVFYHSRHAGFAFYVARMLRDSGALLGPQLDAWLRASVDVTTALYANDGIKPLAIEAKQWYWESDYEVVSHSFDVHALIEASLRYGDPRYAQWAALAFRRLVEHVEADGGVVSHRGRGINFQCRDFWNGHVAWIARVHEHLAVEAEPPTPIGVRAFPESGIVRVETAGYAATIRGRKQPINISFGGAVGGGTLITFSRGVGGGDQVRQPKWTTLAPGAFELVGRGGPGLLARVRAFVRDDAHDVKFRLYVANIERKAGNVAFACAYPFRHVLAKFVDELRNAHASHFDVAPELVVEHDAIRVRSRFCRRDGSALPGCVLVRRYEVGADRLTVHDELRLDVAVSRVRFRLVTGATLESVEGERSSRSGDLVTIRPAKTPSVIHLRWSL